MDPELGNLGLPDDFFLAERLRETLAPSELATLMLQEVEADLESPSILERQLRLVDVQARHAATLRTNGMLVRAYIEASEVDFRNEKRRIMPSGVAYHAVVFCRSQEDTEGKPRQVADIRFLTEEYVNNAPRQGKYEVYVAIDGKPQATFNEDDVNVLRNQVIELRDLQSDLNLSADLTEVRS